MVKISDAVREIVTGNPMFNFGMHHRLLNLSQLARFIHHLVEARTLKEVQTSAVLMSLSRLQKQIGEEAVQPAPDFFLEKINIHTGLCSLTIFKTPESHRELNTVFSEIQASGGFITITEGITEITTILESDNLPLVTRHLTAKPRNVNHHLASVGIKFSDKYLEVTGILYRLLQQVALQNINVAEVASTATEFTIYMHEQDVHLAFESIYQRFAKRGSTATNLY